MSRMMREGDFIKTAAEALDNVLYILDDILETLDEAHLSACTKKGGSQRRLQSCTEAEGLQKLCNTKKETLDKPCGTNGLPLQETMCEQDKPLHDSGLVLVYAEPMENSEENIEQFIEEVWQKHGASISEVEPETKVNVSVPVKAEGCAAMARKTLGAALNGTAEKDKACGHVPDESTVQTDEAQKKAGKKAFWQECIFYVGLAAILLAVYFFGVNSAPRFLFGHAVFSVLTSSMQSELPQGSLVVVRQTPPDEIKIGQDITYIQQDLSTVTHRVVEIIENYEGPGARGFRTKGLENPMADPNIVIARNVLGVVVFHMPVGGEVLLFVKENIWFIVAFIVVCFALGKALRMCFPRKNKKAKE